METNNQKVVVLPHTEVSDPEVLAMLQAMYSRSSMSIDDRMSKLTGDERESTEERLKKSLNQYYVGYGHASIADMANVPVFVENVSMLAAKALQDNELYNGQERSTRYQDFGVVPYLAMDEAVSKINEEWRRLYSAYLPKIEDYLFNLIRDPKPYLTAKFSNTPEIGQLWKKTIKAMAFDVARSLLPCGATTSLSMYMSLRQYRDHINKLVRHPLVEVRDLAYKINAELYSKYPNSFKELSQPENPVIDNIYLANQVRMRTSTALVVEEVNLSKEGQRYFAEINNHHWYMIAGTLDFGSWRDLQRHRPGKQQVPLVVASNGFHNYYADILKKVDPELFSQVLDNLDTLVVLESKGYSLVYLQYGCPMGTMVATHNFWSFNQVKYVLELRSKTSVHPTLRSWCHDLYTYLSPAMAQSINLNTAPDYYASNRGAQDIVKKEGST